MYPQRNEIHRAYFRMYEVKYGRITHEMGHFIETHKGGTGIHWAEGTPVQWFIDDERGPRWPQVVLPDGHIFTCAEDDLVVITKERYEDLMYNRIQDFIVRKEIRD